jgi:hypothetical protein
MFARLADWLIRSKRINLLTSRKIFNTLSQVEASETHIFDSFSTNKRQLSTLTGDYRY